MELDRKGNELVPVTGLLLVAETERAYRVLQGGCIAGVVNPLSVMSYGDIRKIADMYGAWVPKKCMEDVQFIESKVLPNLTISFTLKSNKALVPYKTEIRAKIRRWVVDEHNLNATLKPASIKTSVHEERRKWN